MTTLKELPKLLQTAIRRHGVPGATLAVLRGGRVTEAAAGVLNLDTRVPATTDSLFQIGSITKLLTATLVMQLVDEGVVDLDAPLRAYLPGFRVADPQASRSVTIRQLLCHTGGIEGDFFVDSGRGDDCIARLQDMGRLLPQIFPPGERLSYCNFGFAMLGRLIEHLTGESWDTNVRACIFEPLGMQHALTRPEDTLRYRCAIGHVPDPRHPKTQIVTPMPWLSIGQKAAGATPMASVGDLLKFVAAHLDGGAVSGGGRLLTRGSAREMQRRQHRVPQGMRLGIDGWGLGWFLGTWSGKKVIGHDGGTVGQYSFLRVLPSEKLAVALFTNGGDAGGLYEEIFAATFADWAGVEMPQTPEPLKRLPTDAERILGRFENLTGAITFSRARGGFRVDVEPKPGTFSGTGPTRAPVVLLARDLARLDTDDAVLNRTMFQFQGQDTARPDFVAMGTRLYRRVA